VFLSELQPPAFHIGYCHDFDPVRVSANYLDILSADSEVRGKQLRYGSIGGAVDCPLPNKDCAVRATVFIRISMLDHERALAAARFDVNGDQHDHHATG
jgi:hypothetical protein